MKIAYLTCNKEVQKNYDRYFNKQQFDIQICCTTLFNIMNNGVINDPDFCDGQTIRAELQKKHNLCMYAALYGHLDCLKTAHQNGCQWDESVCSLAAQQGFIDCLKYARENNCTWSLHDMFKCLQIVSKEEKYAECTAYIRSEIQKTMRFWIKLCTVWSCSLFNCFWQRLIY